MNVKIGDKIKMSSYQGIVKDVGDDGFTVKVYSSAIPNELNKDVYISTYTFMKHGYFVDRATIPTEDTG